MMQWLSRLFNHPVTAVRKEGSLIVTIRKHHHWSSWELVDEVLVSSFGGKTHSTIQQRRCTLCGYYQRDNLGSVHKEQKYINICDFPQELVL